MLNDIIENKRLIGNTKAQVIKLLDTCNIKSFDFSNNSWMYIVSIPYDVPSTKTPVKIMDVDFKDNKVEKVTIR